MAGLPLLVLFCVPLTTSVHQGVRGRDAVFCLGMAGYLALLAVDGRERLRLWGRLVTVWHRGRTTRRGTRTGPNTKDLAAAGRRIGLAAVVIALFIPLLVPGLASHKLFAGSARASGPGDLVALPNPLVQMNSELHRTDARAGADLPDHRSGPAVPPGLRAEQPQCPDLDPGARPRACRCTDGKLPARPGWPAVPRAPPSTTRSPWPRA